MTMVLHLVSLVLAATTALLSQSVLANPDVVWRYEARTYTDAEGDTLPYRLFIPDSYDPEILYPVVLFLHSSADRGTDNVRQITDDCVADFLTRPRVQEHYPAFVVAPQAPEGTQWGFYIGSTTPADLAVGIIQQLERQFSIDPDRIYLTGYSMGGMGTFYLIGRYPGLFAAAVPLAGGGDPMIARHITRIPLWAFHGDRDYFVPISGQVRDGLAVYGTRDMIAALRAAGGAPRFTVMEAYGHWIPCWVFRKPELLEWLFRQRRTQGPLARETQSGAACEQC
jgi:predicted peptidase